MARDALGPFHGAGGGPMRRPARATRFAEQGMEPVTATKPGALPAWAEGIENRIALVTGAGRGLGRACALALSEAGARVIAVARTPRELETLAEEAPAPVEVWVEDVLGDPLLARIEALDQLDVLVNNAGTNRPAHFLDVTEEDYHAVSDLNVRAALFVAKAVAEGLIEAGLSGSIINVSSQMGHVGGPKRTVYCATKHALEGATKAMAWELAEHGIRANTICPTFIETPLSLPMLQNAEFNDFVSSRIASGTVGQPEDVMGAVVYLASDASSLVTGSALMVDGGWTAV